MYFRDSRKMNIDQCLQILYRNKPKIEDVTKIVHNDGDKDLDAT